MFSLDYNIIPTVISVIYWHKTKSQCQHSKLKEIKESCTKGWNCEAKREEERPIGEMKNQRSNSEE